MQRNMFTIRKLKLLNEFWIFIHPEYDDMHKILLLDSMYRDEYCLWIPYYDFLTMYNLLEGSWGSKVPKYTVPTNWNR